MPKPIELSVKNSAVKRIDSRLGCHVTKSKASKKVAKRNGSNIANTFDRRLAWLILNEFEIKGFVCPVTCLRINIFIKMKWKEF
jgi:hypothetical protein